MDRQPRGHDCWRSSQQWRSAVDAAETAALACGLGGGRVVSDAPCGAPAATPESWPAGATSSFDVGRIVGRLARRSATRPATSFPPEWHC